MHRGKIDDMALELLRAFTHECYTLAQYHSSSTLLKNQTLNSATQFRQDVSKESSELRNSATRLRHEKL